MKPDRRRGPALGTTTRTASPEDGDGPTGHPLAKKTWDRVSKVAWKAREQAFVFGGTKVGAAVLAEDGEVFGGCNVEHRYRSHDIHAEVNAIASMVGSGRRKLRAIMVVADKAQFTPCGACMDWIFQFGGPDALVGFQQKRGDPIQIWKAGELMPFYPKA